MEHSARSASSWHDTSRFTWRSPRPNYTLRIQCRDQITQPLSLHPLLQAPRAQVCYTRRSFYWNYGSKAMIYIVGLYPTDASSQYSTSIALRWFTAQTINPTTKVAAEVRRLIHHTTRKLFQLQMQQELRSWFEANARFSSTTLLLHLKSATLN